MGGELEELRQRVLEGKGKLCREELESLASWRIEMEKEQQKMLHVEGEIELEGIGERFSSRFPNILSDYNPSDFTFRATVTQRAQESGKFFARGLFGRPVQFEEPVLPHDPLIRSYKLCPKWRSQVKKNPEALREKKLFEESPAMAGTLMNVSHHLGLQPLLTLDQLDLLYVSCNFDLAWRPLQPSPWCALFSKQELEVIILDPSTKPTYIEEIRPE